MLTFILTWFAVGVALEIVWTVAAGRFHTAMDLTGDARPAMALDRYRVDPFPAVPARVSAARAARIRTQPRRETALSLVSSSLV